MEVRLAHERLEKARERLQEMKKTKKKIKKENEAETEEDELTIVDMTELEVRGKANTGKKEGTKLY